MNCVSKRYGLHWGTINIFSKYRYNGILVSPLFPCQQSPPARGIGFALFRAEFLSYFPTKKRLVKFDFPLYEVCGRGKSHSLG